MSALPTYLEHYTLANPWVTWLLGCEPQLLALLPSQVTRSETAPLCPRPKCGQPMKARLVGWACYHHEPPERVPPTFALQRRPPLLAEDGGHVDALALVQHEVDVRYDPRTGCEVAVVVER